MARVDIKVNIIALENVFYPCKIGRASYGSRPGIGRCYQIQTPAGACTIEKDMWSRNVKFLKSSGAQAIIKFADLQIAEIVRHQFYVWP